MSLVGKKGQLHSWLQNKDDPVIGCGGRANKTKQNKTKMFMVFIWFVVLQGVFFKEKSGKLKEVKFFRPPAVLLLFDK